VAAVISFIDCINRGDVGGLGALMTDDHCLVVFAENALIGRAENIAAWHGYTSSFPAYVIYPHRIAERDGGQVAVLGHTTGSHLGLPDDVESGLTLIWLADVQAGRIQSWRLIEDTLEHRREWGLE
jgi:ketosteroid isomerase-like protein